MTTATAAPYVAGDGTEPWHGKRSTYIRKKCRCTPCRTAENDYSAARRKANPEKTRAVQAASSRRYYARNAPSINAKAQKFRAANPEPFRQRGRNHYESKRGYYALKNVEWRQNNPEAWKVKSRRGWDAWSARNPEEVRQAKRRWAATNADAQNEHTRRRRARLRELTIVPFTFAELEARLSLWPGCWICRGPKEAVDHVKPCAAGGAHTLANLRPICKSCNSGKNANWYGPAWAMSLAGNPGSWKVELP